MAGTADQDTLYQHRPFSDQDSIRLLVLQPGDYRDDIQIDLIEAPLSEPPDYEALSYAWGTDVPSTPVFCGNKRILVTSNCALAVRRLRKKRRRFRNEKAFRVLWIDAICIDQSSTLERNHQVQLMGLVFSKAKCVVIWLGEATAWSDYAMSLLDDYYKLLVSKWPSRVREYLLDRKLQDLHKNETEAGIIEGGLYGDVLGSIASNSWFERLWTIQEYVFSRDAHFVYGNKTLHSSTMFVTLQAIKQRRYEMRIPDWYSGWNVHVEIHDKLKSRHLLDQRGPMVLLLSYVRWQSVSDPKDVIFGIHGLRHLYQADVDPPDYSKSLASIYVNATKSAILHDKSLNVLLQTGGKSNALGLPSWVPDWSSPPVCPQTISFKGLKASDNSSSMYKFSNQDEFLWSRGVEIDHVEKCAKSSPPALQGFHEMRAEGNNSLLSKKMFRRYLDSLKSWRALVESRTPYPTGGNAEDAFYQAFAQGLPIDSKPAFFSALERMAGLVKKDSENLLNQSSEEPSHTNEFSNILDYSIEAAVPEVPVITPTDRVIGKYMIELNCDTNFFVTSSGFIGKSLPNVKEGDAILLIAGVNAPVVARRVGDKYMSLGPAYIHGMMEGEIWPEDENELKDIMFC